MNHIQTIHTEYLRPSRTIETISIYNNSVKKILWIYNYEGVYFRVFDKINDISRFFNNEIEAKYSFDDEDHLDSYLLNMQLA